MFVGGFVVRCLSKNDVMSVCMQELNFHVEECLSRNLHVRCSGFVHNVLRTSVQHMHGNDF